MGTLLETVARWTYSALMWAAQPFLLAKLRRRGKVEPGYLVQVSERFGRYTTPPSTGWLWVHAVSLGETRAAALLLERLRSREPGLRLLLTHGTATGRAEGAKLLRSGDVQVWVPWDTPQAVQRFLDHFRPRLGVLMETEVWPNLVRGCKTVGVPLVLVNARLNARSLRRALRLIWLSRPAYRDLTAAYAQTPADADGLQRLGAPVRGVLGNLKFDVPVRPEPWSTGRQWREGLDGRSVLMWASSREGEEALWLSALQRQAKVGVNVAEGGVRRKPLWLVVPRHPQRFDAVAGLLQAQGLRLFRRSALYAKSASAPLPSEALEADVWLGDSLGEMPLYYGLADMALLGGSFLPLGGQNLIEAAACECPVIMGPHTFNFAEASEMAAQAGAAVRVNDLDEALTQMQKWLQAPEELAQARSACLALLQQGTGAADRYAEAILERFISPAER